MKKSLRLVLVMTCLVITNCTFSQPKTEESVNKVSSRTILFIHGAFVNYQCWDEWKSFFEKNGYTTVVPPWPHKNATAVELRNRQPDSKVASIRLQQLVDYYDSIAKGLPEKPILVGHSIGGLIVQLLLQRDCGAAGVLIHSLPPKGAATNFTMLRSAKKALGFFTSTKKSYLMSFKKWQFAYTNGMSLDQQKVAYEKFAVPETKLGLRDAIKKVAKINFKKSHAPILFIAGSIDHSTPASVNKSNFKKYKKHDVNSVTDLKEFEGRNHFVLGQPSWKEDASYVLSWLNLRRSENYGATN